MSSFVLSKNSALKAGRTTPVTISTVSDPRVQTDRKINEENRQQITADFEALLARHAVAIDAVSRGKILSNLVYIHLTASDIRDKWIDMGRKLLRIYRESKEAYDAITDHKSQVLPFDYTVAIKLRKAAEEVERGRVPVHMLPLTYPAVYEVYLMDEPMLAKAVETGVVKPRASRERLARFRKEAKAQILEGTTTVTRESLQAHIRRLEFRKSELIEEANRKTLQLDSDIADLWAKLRDFGKPFTERKGIENENSD